MAWRIALCVSSLRGRPLPGVRREGCSTGLESLRREATPFILRGETTRFVSDIERRGWIPSTNPNGVFATWSFLRGWHGSTIR